MVVGDLPKPPSGFETTKSHFETEALAPFKTRYNIDAQLPVAGLATHRPAFPTHMNATRAPDDPQRALLATARGRSDRERVATRPQRFSDVPPPPPNFATWRPRTSGDSRTSGGPIGAARFPVSSPSHGDSGGDSGGGGVGGGGRQGKHGVGQMHEPTLIRGERRGAESPVPPKVQRLSTRFVTRDGGEIELRRYPWPSDRPHRSDAVDGSARGVQVSTRSAKAHGVHLKNRPLPRLQYPPGYAAHVPRVSINGSAVGKTSGDGTEEYLCKRVARGTARSSHLAPVLPGVDPIPAEVSSYRKKRMPQGRDEDKEALQRTFARTYRGGNTRLEEWGSKTGVALGGTLKTAAHLKDDLNATPFPPKPKFH